jgi:hypothetical protein
MRPNDIDSEAFRARASIATLWVAIALYLAMNGLLLYFTRHHDLRDVIWSVAWLPTGLIAFRVRIALEGYLLRGDWRH